MTEQTVILLSVWISDTNANFIRVIRMWRNTFDVDIKTAKIQVEGMFYSQAYSRWRDELNDPGDAPSRWNQRRVELVLDADAAGRFMLMNELKGRPFDYAASEKPLVMKQTVGTTKHDAFHVMLNALKLANVLLSDAFASGIKTNVPLHRAQEAIFNAIQKADDVRQD